MAFTICWEGEETDLRLSSKEWHLESQAEQATKTAVTSCAVTMLPAKWTVFQDRVATDMGGQEVATGKLDTSSNGAYLAETAEGTPQLPNLCQISPQFYLIDSTWAA